MTVLAGNPMHNVSDVGNVLQVVKGGYALLMEAAPLFPHSGGAATVPPRKRRPYPSIVRAEELSKGT